MSILEGIGMALILVLIGIICALAVWAAAHIMYWSDRMNGKRAIKQNERNWPWKNSIRKRKAAVAAVELIESRDLVEVRAPSPTPLMRGDHVECYNPAYGTSTIGILLEASIPVDRYLTATLVVPGQGRIRCEGKFYRAVLR